MPSGLVCKEYDSGAVLVDPSSAVCVNVISMIDDLEAELFSLIYLIDYTYMTMMNKKCYKHIVSKPLKTK